jgi:hypothetical protein
VRPLFLVLVSLLFASGVAARVTFVAPLDGAQVIGPQTIEVTSDAAAVNRVDFTIDGALAGVARQAPFRIAYDFGTSLAARTITATVWSNGFRTSESASITTTAISATDTLHVDVVELPVRVRSRGAIRKADLRVRENGVEQIVRDVHLDRPPAHFAFVVDRSLSMGDGKLDAALAAIRAEAKQLRPGDTSSIVLFNHHVEPALRIRELGAPVAPSGGTSLRDALASVSSRERTYAIVITDGGDRNSALSEEDALRKISGTKTVVNALVLGDSHARFLDRAATNTGGRVVSASKTTVARELRRVLEDINSRYTIVYQSQGTQRGWRKIDVTARSRNVSVLDARKGYFAE